ncbi:MAG TPA: hypothetical protein VF088_10450 [Pyrinomonadaceae bacterium]
MNWIEQLEGLLQQYTSGNPAAASQVNQDFDRVAEAAPQSTLAEGIAAAFRSDQTPSFGDMVANLFAKSSGQQRTDLVNTLIAAAGPTLVSQILSRSGGSEGVLAHVLNQGETKLAPEEAQRIPANTIAEIAAHAEKRDPSIIDHISGFYAQHPTLVKTLGSAALGIALAKVAQHQYGH